MSVDNKVPKIRFKGFCEDWNQRKLDTIFGKIRNAFVGTATPYYVKEGHFYLESNNVKDGKINRKNEIFINDEFYHKQSDKWLREGDIVMVQSGHVGHTAVIPPELNNIAAHALIMFTDPKEEICSHFLNFQFQTDKVKTKLSEITTGNTIKHILSSEMKEFEMFFSDYEEQTQIGSYFQKLDSLINQHQQKHDKLSKFKKSMLEKMFPKQGKTMPEIRFKGFSGEWNEKTLGEIGDTYTGLSGKTKDDFGHGQGRFVTYLNVFSNAISNENLVEPIEFDINQNEVKKGDVFFTTSSETPEEVGMSSVWMSEIKNVYLNSFCFGYRPKQKLDNYYLAYLLRSNSFRDKIVFLAQGISRYNISKTKVMDIKISIPEYSEQEKIGNYFQKLEMLINHHQQQITKLNNIKQACLSKMFV